MAAVAALLAAPAAAQQAEPLVWQVAQGWVYDDNVFRLAPGLDPQAVLGEPHRGDAAWTTAAGFELDVAHGRQRLTGGLRFERQRHERYDRLDLDAREGRLDWAWEAGERLRGRLGYAESVALASLANVQGGVQTAVPNVLEARRWRFDAALALTPRWRLEGAGSSLRHDNSADEFRASDATIEALRLALVRESRAGNRAGIGLRRDDGALPNPQPAGGAPLDNSYRQEAAEAFVEWQPGGHTRLAARAGPLRRRHRQVPERDFEGWTWRVAAEWAPRAQLTLGAAAGRELSDTEQVNVGFVLAEVLELSAAWKPAPRVDLELRWHRADREYLGEAAAALAGLAPRTERVDALSSLLTWRPREALAVELSLRRERRASPVPLGDFDATVAGLRLRLSF